MKLNKALTLLELMIAVILLSLIALGFTSIGSFSHIQTITADRRAKVQNEASYILEHMHKHISNAIGNIVTDGDKVVDTKDIGGDKAVSVFIDVPDTQAGAAANTPNGSRDTGDRWIAYRFNQPTYSLWYCPQCNNYDVNNPSTLLATPGSTVCISCNPAWGSDPLNTLSSRVVDANPASPDNVSFNAATAADPNSPAALSNSLDVAVNCRWKPGQNVSTDNPQVTLRSRIKMPSVSAN